MSKKGVADEYQILASIGFNANVALEEIKNAYSNPKSVEKLIDNLEVVVESREHDNPAKLAILANELIDLYNNLDHELSDESKTKFIAMVKDCINNVITLDKNDESFLTNMNDEDLFTLYDQLYKLLPRLSSFDKTNHKESYAGLLEIYIRIFPEKEKRSVPDGDDLSPPAFIETMETQTYNLNDKDAGQIVTILEKFTDLTETSLIEIKEIIPDLEHKIINFNREEKIHIYKALLRLDANLRLYLSSLTRSSNPNKKLIESVTSLYSMIKERYEGLSEEFRVTGEKSSNEAPRQNLRGIKQETAYNTTKAMDDLVANFKLNKSGYQICNDLGLNDIEIDVFSYQIDDTKLLELSVFLNELQSKLTAYESSLASKDIRLHKKQLEYVQSRLATLHEECTSQLKDIENIRASCSKFDSDKFKDLLNTVPGYNPKNETPHDRAIARNIARKIGLRSRLSYLKRKIYKAQILGSEKNIERYRHKVNSYLGHLRRIVDEQKDGNLRGVLRAEIRYAENIIKESQRPITPSLKSERVNRLFLRNPKRSISERIAASIEKLHLGNSKLYEKSKIEDAHSVPNKIIKIFRKKVNNLMLENFQLFHKYSYILYLKFKQDKGEKITKKEAALIEQLPEIREMIFNSLQFIHSNIDASQLEAAIQTYPQSPDIELGIDPVYNLLTGAKELGMKLSEQSAIDIIRGTGSDDQKNVNPQLKQFIEENVKINKIKLNKYLEQFAKSPPPNERNIFQERRANKLQKNIVNLLGLRELNNLLAAEATLNTALSDKYDKLSSIRIMSENYSAALVNASQNLSTGLTAELNTALAEVIKSEALVAGRVINQVHEAKQIIQKRQIHNVEEVPLSTASKAAYKVKHKEYPPTWTTEVKNTPKEEKKDSGNGSVPPPVVSA